MTLPNTLSHYSSLGSHTSSDGSPPTVTSTSPHSSPKHSPRASRAKDKADFPVREPSPFLLDKTDGLDLQESSLNKSTDSIQPPPDFLRSTSHDSGKDRKESRGSDRSKKKSSWYSSVLNPTYKSRSEEFKRYFKDVPQDERLLVDYSCALQKDILVHGRLYVTQNYLCFYANIFRWETCVCIRWKDVTGVAKEKTALVIPNAILISANNEKHFFTTFGTRDKAFMMLFRVWQNALMDQPMSTQEMWHFVHVAYGEELGLTSEDEDYHYVPPASLDEKHFPSGVRLSADSLSEDGCRVTNNNNDRGTGSDVGSSLTDSNKSQASIPSHVFLTNDAPSPNALVDPLPTDLSDTSESDMDRKPAELTNMTCSSPHQGRLLLNTVLPVHVDQLFTLLFTNSKFFVEFHALRRTTDIKMSSWQQTPESDEKLRTISMTMALNQTLGPKSSNVQETQVMNGCSKPGVFYSIDGEAVNTGIPYADSFYILTHTCMARTGENQTSLSIYAEIRYKKSVWSFVKNLIEKNSWMGLEDFHDNLLKALHSECDDGFKGRKSRRRHRGLVTKPVLLPVDDLPRSAIGAAFAKVGKCADKDGRYDILSIAVFLVLLFLVFLNVLLYYKLWLLEDWAGTSRTGFTDKLPYVEILEHPPQSHEEWLELLRRQENLHRLELEEWQKVLQTAVALLRKAEESLSGLEGTIKTSFAEKAGPDGSTEKAEL